MRVSGFLKPLELLFRRKLWLSLLRHHHLSAEFFGYFHHIHRKGGQRFCVKRHV